MVITNGKPLFFKSKSAQAYQKAITLLSRRHAPSKAYDGPLRVDYIFILPRPQRLNKKTDPACRIPADKRPDRDNLIKGTQDAILGFWEDDAQIVDGRTGKYYAAKDETAKIEIHIFSVTN